MDIELVLACCVLAYQQLYSCHSFHNSSIRPTALHPTLPHRELEEQSMLQQKDVSNLQREVESLKEGNKKHVTTIKAMGVSNDWKTVTQAAVSQKDKGQYVTAWNG